MPTQVGTYDISTLLATRFTSANAYGLDTIAQILIADTAAHNTVVQEALMSLADVTTDKQRIYGTSAGGEMVEVDEYGRSATQRAATGSTVGFPLRRFQYGIGWTDQFFQKATPADLAIMTQAAQKAHLRAVRKAIKQAIYTSTNTTYKDYLDNFVDIPVKAFVNADGADIPDAPDGTAFDSSTHTHYTAINGLTNAAALALVTNVVEHGHGGNVVMAINYNDEATVRALGGFVAAPDYRVIPATTGAVTVTTTNPGDQYNRYIGILGAAEVWIKPWALQSYLFVYDAADPGKPLAMRQDSAAALQGLRIAAELPLYPLYARYMTADFGFGAWTRTNGAVLYFGGASYVDPTITA